MYKHWTEINHCCILLSKQDYVHKKYSNQLISDRTIQKLKCGSFFEKWCNIFKHTTSVDITQVNQDTRQFNCCMKYPLITTRHSLQWQTVNWKNSYNELQCTNSDLDVCSRGTFSALASSSCSKLCNCSRVCFTSVSLHHTDIFDIDIFPRMQ